MKKIMANGLETQSADVIAENVEHLKTLFPEAFTEGKVDFEVLKQLLGGAVDEREEKYGLNWHGKRQARQLALTPSTGSLRPCPGESVDWDTTQNLVIEGDNLEVLKLLQKSYAGKVKLIYIDPPYNTGKDFIYPDDYRDNIKNYLELTGQIDGENRKLSSNTEASGRFHTDWLNMMYPRLKLARNLLKEDGVLFISIDDNEQANLKRLCDEVFGEENHVNTLCVKMSESTGVKMTHADQRLPKLKEYVLFYKKMEVQIVPPLIPKDNWDNEYKHLVCGLSKEEIGELKTIIGNESSTESDIVKADYICRKISLKPLDFLYDERNATTEDEKLRAKYENAWRIVRDVATATIARKLADQKKLNTDAGFFLVVTPKKKKYLIKSDYNQQSEQPRIRLLFADQYLTTNPGDFWQDIKTTGLDNEGGVDFRNGKKPLKLLDRLLRISTASSDLVLDFFAGSCTTAHAVLGLNKEDISERKFIMVQLPERCDGASEPKQAGFNTIADIGRERIRLAGREIRRENPDYAGDLGFRVFKLDTSNIRAWEPNRDNLEGTLLDSVDHIKSDRSEDDILYELLLKLGLDLCVPIETRTIAGKSVRSIGAGTLIACLDEHIAQTEVEPLALGIAELHKEIAPAGDSTVVFRDSAFEDDVAKTNLAAILEQYGLGNVRSL